MTDHEEQTLDTHIAPFVEAQAKATTGEIYGTSVLAFSAWCRRNEVEFSESVSQQSVEDWFEYLSTEQHVSAGTLSTRYWSLRAFFRYLVANNVIVASPIDEVEPPHRGPAPSMPLLTRTELNGLTVQAKLGSPTDDALISLMATMGLSVTQACDVLVEEVHRGKDGKLSIELMTRSGELVVAKLPAATQASIERVIGNRSAGPLLPRRDESPMSRRSADRVVKRIAKAAKLNPKLASESVRQSFIATRVEDGVPVWVLAEEARLHEGSVRNHVNRARRERTILG